MRIHNLLIAGALAGLMSTAGLTHAQEVKKPPSHHTMQQPSPHKKMMKHGHQQHTAMKSTSGKTKTEPGTVSKQLMGKSNPKHQGHNARSSKHYPVSKNVNHKKSGHSTKSTSKTYQ